MTERPERTGSTGRLAAFAGLAAFATAHWGALVDPAPGGRLALVVVVAVAGGVALTALDRSRIRRPLQALLGAGGALAAIVLGLVAIGIPPALLWPAGWNELASNLDHGLLGLAGEVEYPYADDNEWSRLAVLAVAPVALGLAAALSFWPGLGRARTGVGLSGLAILVALYATAAAAISPGGALARGAVLLALVGAWLWLPTLRWREAGAATAVIAAAGALAVPAAAQLRAEHPWLDYRSWTLRGADGTTYSWDHSYGPIDWPRDGRQMLAVHSAEPHYWKSAVLDRFDGVRWARSDRSSLGARDLAASGGGAPPAGADPRWMREFAVTVGHLESEIVVAAGTPTRVLGVDDAVTAPDGTTFTRAEPLKKGDSYRVRAYVPDPPAQELRSVSPSQPAELVDYTRIELPAGRGDGEGREPPPETVATPVVGVELAPGGVLDGPAAERIARSPYGPMLELTRSLTANEPTTYDAARSIQDHLRSEYEYSEFPPRRTYPLASFLFEDRRGYCQQFSGAMALMLRMAGVPARVASGFAPGTRDSGDDPFRVEDFDAHSWVEVHFPGIGWVAFDPTPSAAPVSTQQVPGFPTAEADHRAGVEAAEAEEDTDQAAPLPAPGAGGSGGTPSLARVLVAPIALLVALAIAAAAVATRSRRHRRLAPEIAAEAQLTELERALARFGWTPAPGTTLLGLERRLHRSRRRYAARYVARLRAARYGTATIRPPGLAARRSLRRELGAAAGPRGRLRALIAVPPGGPRAPSRAAADMRWAG